MKTYKQIFDDFTPTYLFTNKPFINDELIKKYGQTKLIICGEIHGIKENADALYSIVKTYGCEILAIERTKDSSSDFIDSVIHGNPNFNVIDDAVFTASMLSIEMAKTIYCLFKEGLVNSISYIDTSDDETEKGLAHNLLALDTSKKVIAIMGNWHTMRRIFKDDSIEHISSLRRVREVRHAISIEYQYGSGTYYNNGTGLDTIEQDDSISENKLIFESELDFKLLLLKATAIEERPFVA
jgi:hypothetical protein